MSKRRSVAIRLVFATVALAVLIFAAPIQARISPERLRQLVFKSDPCLANIIDNENGRWDPTLDFGGGHGNVYESYGLVQANPGTKMASAGKDWRTNPWTQIKWGKAYARARYGSTCAAWEYWKRHRYW